jgi:carboxyl-terminal processing protease
VQTLPGTPAERVGLRPGDRLIEVDGESMHGWNPDRAVGVLRGPRGSSVDLMIARIGVSEPIPVTIVRDEIHVVYVTAFMYEPKIGYIRHQQFSDNSADDIRQAIAQLEAEGMTGLILDIRGNPGGLLEEGVAVSDLFLESGKEVGSVGVPSMHRLAVHFDEPVTGPQADPLCRCARQRLHDRALVVGTPTYGKGSVQTLYPLDGGNFLKLTTAKWYTPSGRSIQREPGEHGPMVAMGEPGEMTASGEAVVYYTESGREVFGGGGINPDLIVRSDTTTQVERDFRTALGEQLGAYYDAVFRFAVAYSDSHPELKPDFHVSNDMLVELYAWIEDSGIEVSRELFDGARRLVERELGIQLATVTFDEKTSLRRRLFIDRQVETAAELLREGDSQAQLFALAGSRESDNWPPAREN